jgi:hypothetical protein
MTQLFAEYVRHGWRLCPIEPGSKGPKGPEAKGWQHAERAVTDPKRAAALPGAGLLHAWARTCALDIDRLEDAEGWLAVHGIDLRALLEDDTAVRINSGRPGRAKLLYALPAGVEPLPTYQRVRGALEFRCATADGLSVQDVLPPTVHPDTGAPYEWAGNGDWRDLPELPLELLALWLHMPAEPAAHDGNGAAGAAHVAAPAASGIAAGTRNNTLFKHGCALAAQGKNAGEIITALLAMNAECKPPLPLGEVRTIGHSAAKYKPEVRPTALLTNDKGVILACEHNAFVLLEASTLYTGLHFDEFLSRLRFDERDWTDADDLDALRWLQSKHGVARFTLGHTRHAAQSLAYSRRHDSLREFVENLPTWDGTPRIEQAFADAWGAPDTELIRAASSNFFVALIARALQPGAQVDTLWTFEGPQGSFKSRALRELGGKFHAEVSASIGTTDFQRELRGLWLAEMSELDSLRGREASTIKRLLSAPADRFVQKYALHAESYPRRAVAVATTNEAAYWQDATGARRLVPIPCADIRCDLITAHRLQWFAEARHLHAHGQTWWNFPDTIANAQEDRQQVDPWEDIIRTRMTGTAGYNPKGQITSASIMRDWLELAPHQQGPMAGTRLGKVMRRLGFTPARIGHAQERGWQRADTADPQLALVSA